MSNKTDSNISEYDMLFQVTASEIEDMKRRSAPGLIYPTPRPRPRRISPNNSYGYYDGALKRDDFVPMDEASATLYKYGQWQIAQFDYEQFVLRFQSWQGREMEVVAYTPHLCVEKMIIDIYRELLLHINFGLHNTPAPKTLWEL